MAQTQERNTDFTDYTDLYLEEQEIKKLHAIKVGKKRVKETEEQGKKKKKKRKRKSVFSVKSALALVNQ